MTDLEVRTEALHLLALRVDDIRSRLAGAPEQAQQAAASAGHTAVVGALNDFSSHWTKRRAELDASLADVGASCNAIHRALSQADGDLAAAVRNATPTAASGTTLRQAL